MPIISLPAHYDGKHIRIDEPFELRPNTKLMVTILPDQATYTDRLSWLRVSEHKLRARAKITSHFSPVLNDASGVAPPGSTTESTSLSSRLAGDADDSPKKCELILARTLSSAYSDDEPEYSCDLIEESNPEYEAP